MVSHLVRCIAITYWIFNAHMKKVWKLIVHWWAVLQSTISCISCKSELPCILFNALIFISPFLSHTQGSHYYWYYGTVVVLRCYIISVSIFTSFYLFILLYLFTGTVSVGTDLSVRSHVFLLLYWTNIFDLLIFNFLAQSAGAV